MILNKIVLVNYIGIYNGIGKTSITIDFSKCKNPITVIKGDNGSGKSTLFKALNPFNDPNSSLIPGFEASKHIAYQMDNGEIINISYIYPINSKGERKSPKCSIIRVMPNGDSTELNPNGNVTEGKEMICSIFDFDQTFTVLSQLSSENRGIADKKPADRKQLINSIMESLSTYNDIYKKLSKKSSALKSMIQSINTKISQIGDITSIEGNIKKLEDNLGKLEDRKNELLIKSGKYKSFIDDTNIVDINEQIANVTKTRDYLTESLDKLNERNDFSIKDLQIELEDNKAALENLKIENAKAISANDIIIPKMAELSSKINAYIEESKLYINTENKISIMEDIDAVTKYRDELIEKKESLSSLANISEEEIEKVVADVASIMEYKEKLHNIDYDIKCEAAASIFDPDIIQNNNDDLFMLVNTLSTLESILSEQNKYRELSAGYDNIPSECKFKDLCYFVKNIVENKKSMISDEEYKKIVNSVTELKEKIDTATYNIERQKSIDNAKHIMNAIIRLYDSNASILVKLGSEISNNLAMEEFLSNDKDITLNIDVYRDLKSINNLLSMAEDDLKKYMVTLDAIENKEKNLKRINDSKKVLQDEYDSYKKIYVENTSKIKLCNEQLPILSKNIESLEHDIDTLLNISEIEQQICSLSDEIELLDIKRSTYKKYKEELESDLMSLQEINLKLIPEIQEELNKNKYNAVLYNDYIKEYKEFSNKYNMIETVKRYTSPTTGIQTIFMSVYMNDVINIANQLLQMMFNGEYTLYPFVINESEFRIPCSGSGYLNDDISSMSTSQICLISTIISFALLHKSSNIYNIAMLDEIDGGLDHVNRLNFSGLLMKLMKVLNFHQTIMISHNSELDMSNCDVIIMKNSDHNLKLEGNIIFNANS